MSSYYNKFKDGPNDKPTKKKNKNSSYGWSNVLKSATKTGLGSHKRRKKEQNKQIKKGSGY